ncbi:hypothetical protein LTR70_001353 [Exophiala xenobiotica]|uniref:Uncharacterized protein n=1 Tax=Lithohypha guttulata TaxID=1690604 RepID=A0ABR0KPG4_9EURO|nr:hypothetical protein LTR24_000892 [Lithohypha guttulata]KAK5328032.1 hypothetical protein LTR70_001353 [Exophiala xenobiotica]
MSDGNRSARRSNNGSAQAGAQNETTDRAPVADRVVAGALDMAAQSQVVPSLAPTTTAPSQPAIHESTVRPMSLLTSAFTPRAPYNDPTPAPRGRLARFNPEASEFFPGGDVVSGSAVPSFGGRPGQGGQATRAGYDAQGGYMARGGNDFLRRGPATPSGIGGQLGVPGQNTFNGQFRAGMGGRGRTIIRNNFQSTRDIDFSASSFERLNYEYGQQGDNQQAPQRWRDPRQNQAQANAPTVESFNTPETTASDTAAAPPDTADPPSRGRRNVEPTAREDDGE